MELLVKYGASIQAITEVASCPEETFLLSPLLVPFSVSPVMPHFPVCFI